MSGLQYHLGKQDRNVIILTRVCSAKSGELDWSKTAKQAPNCTCQFTNCLRINICDEFIHRINDHDSLNKRIDLHIDQLEVGQILSRVIVRYPSQMPLNLRISREFIML